MQSTTTLEHWNIGVRAAIRAIFKYLLRRPTALSYWLSTTENACDRRITKIASGLTPVSVLLENQIERDYISKFERGILEPTLDVLLAYARAISTTGRGEYLEVIIDDKMDLPDKLPSSAKQPGIKRLG